MKVNIYLGFRVLQHSNIDIDIAKRYCRIISLYNTDLMVSFYTNVNTCIYLNGVKH